MSAKTSTIELTNNWLKIRKLFSKAFSSNFHVTIASVDPENEVTATPIGSLFLNFDQTGFYFEKYPAKLVQAARLQSKICVLAVNSSPFFWLSALFTNRFAKYPAVKLYGRLGQKRLATDIELKLLRRRMRFTAGLKGHDYLWGKMKQVREIHFEKAELINLGNMTENL